MRGIRRGLVIGLAAVLMATAAGCSDDDGGGKDDASDEERQQTEQEEAATRADLELPVPPLEEEPTADPCDLFQAYATDEAIVEALGSEIEDTEVAPWTGADTSWTASCVLTGAPEEPVVGATASLTLSSAALPQGTDEIATIEGAMLDPEQSVVTWAHEGLNLSVRVNHLPRDEATAAADNDAVVTLAESLASHL